MATYSVASEPGAHLDHLLSLHEPSKVVDDVGRVVVWDRRAPSGSDSVRSVDEHHRQHGHVPGWLNLVVVVGEVLEQWVVGGVEDGSVDGRDVGEDVTRRGMVLSSLVSGSVLTRGDEQVDVVGPDKVLSESDDRSRKRDLSVMVGSLLGHESSELSDLDGVESEVSIV